MREGRTYKKLGEVATYVADGDWIESKDQSEDGIRLIQTGNIGNGVFKLKEDKPHYISKDTFSRIGCNEIFEGDCLISRLPDPRVLLNMRTDYNIRHLTLEIKRYFEMSADVQEVLIYSGSKEISIKRNIASSKGFLKMMMNSFR